ncbi:hypothetical protein LguiA_008158 [Lonicera macranthoides]
MLRVEKLGQGESIKLFSLKAFGKDFPPKSYIKHTVRAVQICEGLPLALKVIGTSLSRKRENEWVPELTKLESIPQMEILEILKISYDSLQDNYDKSLFLDIACFFVGINKDYAIKILEKWDPLVKIRIQNLIDRCLLTIGHRMVLTMHRLIQDMGRKFVQEESCEVGERSRLWHHQEVFDVLEYETFLGSLKILDLSYSECLARTPNFLHLQNLERLILKGCVSLVEVCDSIGSLEMLDLLDLQDCRTLRKLPRSIGKLGSLKTLTISGCNIGELPTEMRNMQSLEVLEADGIFTNQLRTSSGGVKWWERIIWPMVATLRKGPETIWASLPFSLRELSLARCNLSDESFPMNFIHLPSLYDLDLSYNPFHRLPNLIRSLSFRLSRLNIRECHRLRLLDFNGLSTKSIGIEAEGCRSLETVMPLNGSVDFWSSNGNELGMHDYGVYSICLHGGRIPTFTGEKCEGSSSICFTVPLLPTCGIQYLNVWCKLQRNDETVYLHKYEIHLSIKIKNRTKDLTWIEQYNRPGYGKYTGWLNRWRLGNQLKAGDEIIITFDCDYSKKFKVKECGYKIVYSDLEEEKEEEEEEEEEKTVKGSTLTIEESPHHLAPLRLSRGNFFSYVMHTVEEDPNKDY